MNNKPLSVAFVWHMHQPMYKDPVSQKVLMPWVRMHSIKAYNDMIRIAQEYPAVHQTFNLVPSLLVQIEDSIAHPDHDVYWQVSSKPASDLTDEDKELLLSDFFMANWDTMIKPYPRYTELFSKRGGKDGAQMDINAFAQQDYRDLQVFFNLTWFGYMARKKYPVLAELIKKGHGYTETDKKTVLDTQAKVLHALLGEYKKAQDSGQVEISVSPFYHPILPLLMDSDFAKRAMPWAPLPERFHHPEDAKAQITKALDKAQHLFGKRPKGMWPSEGSVCEELVELFADAGVEWIATDEEILMQSIAVSDRAQALYKPYRAEHKGKSVGVVFRDHSLSDMIGFVYSKNDPIRSADDLIGHLHNIRDHLKGKAQSHLVSIILDGENPWEYYPDGGEAFLRRLFERLSEDQTLAAVKVGEYLHTHKPQDSIEHLHSGSWIAHNYDIWIGSTEENTAWNLLKKTRDFLCEHIKRHPSLDKTKVDAAWQDIYMAEGSDWFWWYGDDFSTENDAMFDELFRTHLANVYRNLGLEAPEVLRNSIIAAEQAGTLTPPVAFISPVLDGKITHFYEWQESGHFNVGRAGSTMHRNDRMLQNIHYGFDLHHLYLRLDPLNAEKLHKKNGLFGVVHVIKPMEYQIVFPFSAVGKQQSYDMLYASDGMDFKKIKTLHGIAIDKVVECSIAFSDLKVKAGDIVQFAIAIRGEKIELERVPQEGFISLEVPDEEFESKMWSV